MLRDVAKRAVAAGVRTRLGKQLLNAAVAPEVHAVRFAEVRAWPSTVDGFEDLSFLFTSSQLNHGIASLRFDEAALLYRVVRSLGRSTIAEIGRFKGGSTFVIAAAKEPGSVLWSYDLHVPSPDRPRGADLDSELLTALHRFALDEDVHLVVGDSTTVEQPADPLDFLFIDGDHSYEGARADLRRWGPRLRPHGHLLLHDAVDTGGYGNYYPGVARVVEEVLAEPDFEQLGVAGTIVHLRRRS
jgi:predicted O-methyltransferase YrrM